MRMLSFALLIALLACPCGLSSPAEDALDQIAAMVDAIKPPFSRNLDAYDTVPLDQSTGDFLREQAKTIELIRGLPAIGAEAWSTRHEPGAPMTVIASARKAARLALLQGRYDFAHGKTDDAVKDFLSAMAIGRHIGSQKLSITRLVDIAIESMAIEQLAPILPKLPREALDKLPEQLGALPKGATWKEMLSAELEFSRRYAATNNMQPDLVEALKPSYDAIAAAGDLPQSEFEARVNAESAKVLANPLGKIVFPNLIQMHNTIQRGEVKLAMLCAAIDILRGVSQIEGPAFERKDPAGSGPFTYREIPGGFELSSKLLYKNQPVTLKVGSPD